MKPISNGGDKTGSPPSCKRRIRVFHPGFLGAQIGPAAETDLCLELTIPLPMQRHDEELKGGLLSVFRLRHDMRGFIPQRSAVPSIFSSYFDRPAEAAFTRIEAGKLVGVLSCRSHSQSNARKTATRSLNALVFCLSTSRSTWMSSRFFVVTGLEARQDAPRFRILSHSSVSLRFTTGLTDRISINSRRV